MQHVLDVDRVFARLCRATPDDARLIGAELSPGERASIALICYSKTHLRDVGRALASTCDESSLVREGGNAGAALYSIRTFALDTHKASRRSMSALPAGGVSLAD